jgi:hypothetical protein
MRFSASVAISRVWCFGLAFLNKTQSRRVPPKVECARRIRPERQILSIQFAYDAHATYLDHPDMVEFPCISS